MLRFLALAVIGLIGVVGPTCRAIASGDMKVVVILDNSGSMAERMPGGSTRLEAAKQALMRVLEQAPADADLGVLLLNPGPNGNWLVPLGPVDPDQVQRAVGGLWPDGGTPLGSTMKTAADALLALRQQQRYGNYKLLIVTDGEANDGQLVEQYLPEIQARGLLVDVIGVSMAEDHSLATRTSTYRNANDPASLEKAISEVVLGESSANANDAGQGDFDLIAALPAEVAAASLAALAQQQNEPVGEAAATASAARGPMQSIPNQPAPPPAVRDDRDSTFMTMAVLGIMFLVIVRIVTAIGKRR